MNLERILAISGKPGLYALKMQTRTGFVAESLVDGKKVTVGMQSNVSLLSEISVYTYSEEKPLVEVMSAIAKKENGGEAPRLKEDKAALLAYFGEVLPDYDQDRVYPSDVKKILNWYNILQAKGLVVLAEEVKVEETKKEEVAEEKPKKTRATKAKKEETTGEKEEKPKKPRATKKTKSEE
ncbi:hypothetical protein B0A78_05850 [Flavobacterium columnare NBRC 100251 = ATCC 23463]|uniref:Uncharacterized protein n=1 Tax=Flavobacterium columnare (strain ATCC 49512 / CIP 103533 / TG 44/87) TaxID=1041826 RepID=G8XB82_FLACA|nr:DUF5606 domain-containing protein [Flavobacterium columnare]AEW86050.1 hypothetical protein FCOL_06145 [Flavobacterium columnare ATCC 49512]ANO48139.1 hypothetical protein Pf1_02685 [Flavobacterium columnare]APT21291.1 hypothetical protein BU993_00770 [Flavobacterium columnare]MBF6651527.1 hypothetical protein [Flavobacterium columnare]MBF6655887.1 hypothetical protein [Flavobacterium columnare]